MADLQDILSSGDITNYQESSTASGNELLTSDEIDSKDATTLAAAKAYADGLVETPTTTTVNVASYSVLATDEILHVTYPTTGTCLIELTGTVLTDGFTLVIKDGSGNAGTNNITIDSGDAFIDGDTEWVINGNYDWIQIYSDGSNFFIIS